jgi:hypothetical protein
MARAIFFAALFLVTSFGCDTTSPGPALPAPGIQIPLKEILALDMPGTQSVREAGDTNNLLAIAKALELRSPHLPEAERIAGPGFAVAGSNAYQEVAAIMSGEKKAKETFSPEDEISLFFFSIQYGAYVHIKAVERIENVVKIHFVFGPHGQKQHTTHFAIIPLGKLPLGKYDVQVVQEPMDTKIVPMEPPVNKTWEKEVVSKGFSFSVE